MDCTTGFLICPKTKEFIDSTRPYCKSCFTFGYSQTLSTGCEKQKEKEETNDGNNVDKE